MAAAVTADRGRKTATNHFNTEKLPEENIRQLALPRTPLGAVPLGSRSTKISMNYTVSPKNM